MKGPPTSSTLLIAESGATKTEWRYRKEDNEWISLQSVGLNPSNFAEEDLLQTLEKFFSESPISTPLGALYFFGAGLRNEATRSKFKRVVQAALPGMGTIHLQDDLEAAVWACERDAGIVAILGTGSNSCYFEDRVILDRKGGLGYLLGDEGSGMDLGRSLVQALLREELPKEVQDRVLTYLQTDTRTLRNHVYEATKPALFFASLAPTLKHFETEPTFQQLLANRFERFLQTHVLALAQAQQVPIDFVGSIAYHFQSILSDTLAKYGLEMGEIIRHPIDKLTHILNSQKKL